MSERATQRSVVTLALVAALALVAGAGAAGPTQRPSPYHTERSWLTRDAYPMQVSISFTASLFHWLDSLLGVRAPGLSAGKTVEAHRRTFQRLFGEFSDRERELLAQFGEIRRRLLEEALQTDDWQAGRAAGRDPAALLVTFLEADSLQSALERSGSLLTSHELARLQQVLGHFAPKHARVWDGGKIPRRFVDSVRDHRRLGKLEDLLARIARLHGVDPRVGQPAHLVLTPVPAGFGTHAQANGRHLLIELRYRDGLATTAPVIVHENAHLMASRMDPAAVRRLDALAEQLGPRGRRAARSLREALPTALGQGVAGKMFLSAGSWGPDRPWYHTADVDGYAKRIFPLVERVLDDGRTLDEPLLQELLELY